MITDYLCLLRLNERHFSTCKVQKLWVWYRVFSFLFKTRISFYSWLHSMSQMNWIKGCKKLEQEKVNNLVLITIRGIGIHHKCDFERSLVSYFVPSLLAKSVRSTLFLWTEWIVIISLCLRRWFQSRSICRHSWNSEMVFRTIRTWDLL